jgi:hypothetical protein
MVDFIINTLHLTIHTSCSGGSNLPINITSSIKYSFKLIEFCKENIIDINIARVSYLQVEYQVLI